MKIFPLNRHVWLTLREDALDNSDVPWPLAHAASSGAHMARFGRTDLGRVTEASPTGVRRDTRSAEAASCYLAGSTVASWGGPWSPHRTDTSSGWTEAGTGTCRL